MPFCPNCRFEYLPEVTHCPTCNAALVPERPPAPPASEADLEQVVLCIVMGGIQARLVQAELARQGIPSRLRTGYSYDPLLWTLPAPPPPIGGPESGAVAIYVNRRDLDRARVVYHDLETLAAASEEPEDEEEEE